jgi:hypothetical protein
MRYRVTRELVVGEDVERPCEDVDLAGADEIEVFRGEQAAQLVLADRCGVREGLLDQSVGVEPLGGQAMELGHDLRARARELETQQLAEEVVVAVPVPRPSRATRKRFERSRSASTRSASSVPRTASHDFAENRSKIDVLSRKVRVLSSTVSSTSDAR